MQAQYDAKLEQFRQKMQKYRSDILAKYQQRLRTIQKQNRDRRAELSKKITAEKNEQRKAALRQQYLKLSSRYTAKMEKQTARFQKWKVDNRNRTVVLPRISKNINEMIKWATSPTDVKHVPEKLKGILVEFLRSVDLAGNRTSQKAEAWRMRMTQMQNAVFAIETGRFENLDFYADFDPDFSPRLQKFLDGTAGVRTVHDMDAAQLKELDFLTGSLRRAITLANQIMINKKAQSIAMVGEKSMAEMDKFKEAKNLGKGVGAMRDLLQIDQLDSPSYGDRLGPTGKNIIKEMRKGLDVKAKDVQTAEKASKEILGNANVSAMDKGEITFDVTGGKLKLTKAQIMSLYCLLGRKQALKHIFKGGIRTENMTRPVKVNEFDVSNIIATLTEEELKIAKGLQKFMQTTVAGWGNEISMKLYGYLKFTENGYFPIRVDKNSVRTSDRTEADTGLYRLKNMGMTKAVLPGASNAIMLEGIFDVFASHVDEMSSYHGFVIPVGDAMKYFNYKGGEGSVKESIERALGKKGKAYFVKLLQDINGYKMETTGIGDKWLRNAKTAAVGANLRVVVQQPTAYLRAMNMISPKYLVAALAHKPNVKLSKQYCMISQWKSYGFFDLNIGKGLKEILVGGENVGEKLRSISLAPAQLADEITWGYIWKACELETKAKRKDLTPRSDEFYQAVGDRMSEVVDRTQVVDSVFHRSGIMRERGASKFFTSFMSEPTKTYNMLRTAIENVARDGSKANVAKLSRTIATFTLTGLLTAAAAGLVDAGRDDDDDKTWLEKFGTAFGGNTLDILSPLNMIPYFREVQNLMQGFQPNRLDLRGMQYFVYGFNDIADWAAGKTTKSAYGIIYNMAQGFSYLTGIPLSNAMRPMENMYALITGSKPDKKNEVATAAKAYENLFNAYLTGNKSKIASMTSTLRSGTATLTAKSTKEIDTGVAHQLMLNDPRIKQAYEAKLTGAGRQVLTIKNSVTKDGFSGEMFDKAIADYEALATKKVEPKDLDEQLDTSLYNADDLGVAVEHAAKTGDTESLTLIYSELLADSGAVDPVASLKGSITRHVKPIYLQYYDKGDAQMCETIELILEERFEYKPSQFNEWIKEHPERLSHRGAFSEET